MEEQKLTELYIKVSGGNLPKDYRTHRCRKVNSCCYLGDVGGEGTHISKYTKLEESFINTAIICSKVVSSGTTLTKSAIRAYITVINADRAYPGGLVSEIGNGACIMALIIQQVCHIITLLAFSIHTSVTVNTVLTHTLCAQWLITCWTTTCTISHCR